MGCKVKGMINLADIEDQDYAVLVLQALVAMARRSKYRRADLMAALHHAHLLAEPARIQAAVAILRSHGSIEKLVPLADGGLLLSVTPYAMEHPGPPPRWRSFAELEGGGS